MITNKYKLIMTKLINIINLKTVNFKLKRLKIKVRISQNYGVFSMNKSSVLNNLIYSNIL